MVEWVGKMLKRKDGKRSDWKRISKRSYAQSLIETEEFNGHVTLLHAIQVSHPLNVHYEKEHVCTLDDGYMWLQQFPSNAHHAVTTMFDASGNIVQWYIDICLQNGFSDGSPWWEASPFFVAFLGRGVSRCFLILANKKQGLTCL